MWQYNYSDELYHFGKKNMHWGDRLYQYKDGSLTPLGKIRYGTKGNLNKVKAAKKSISTAKAKAKADKARDKANARTQAEVDKYRSKAAKKAKKIYSKPETETVAKPSTKPLVKRKKVGNMTDEEIVSAIARRRLENDYKKMFEPIKPEKTSKGKAIVDKVINDMVAPAATSIGKQYVTSLMAKAVNERAGLGEEYKVYTNNKKKS